MILPDTNVWIALTISGHSHHERVLGWFDSVSESGAARFCRATQRSLLRLLTTAATHAEHGDPARSNLEAWQIYRETLTDDRVGPLMAEPAGTESEWQRLSTRNTPSPKLWMDSYLAAFAIAGDMTFVTIDKAFRQFGELDLHLIN